jgi:hypothetical protein
MRREPEAEATCRVNREALMVALKGPGGCQARHAFAHPRRSPWRTKQQAG